MLARQMAAPNSPQWFNTGLHWAYGIDGPAQGHFFADDQTGEVQALDLGLRAAAAARLLHPEHPGRPGQSGRHHGSVGARGAAVQVRLRHRHQLLEPARRERAALGRRQVVRPDELPQDRRPRRRRDQVRRHHAARRQDGHGRRRPSRHRGRSSAGRCARSRRSRRWSPARGCSPAIRRDHDRLPRRRPSRGRPLRPHGEPGPEAGDARGAPGAAAGRCAAAGDPLRPPGLHPDRDPDLRRRLGLRRLPHGLRPELEQLGAGHATISRARARGPRVAADPPHRRQGRQDPAGRGALGPDRIAAWASADPGVQYDTTINEWHTCPASGRINASNPCSEYMFLDDTACNLASLEPDLLPPRGRHASPSRTSPMRSGCGPWCSRSR